jgi:hypothetical protein
MITTSVAAFAGNSSPIAPAPIVRWVFRRGNDALTCAVDARRTGSGYDVSVVPHWDVSSTLIEGVDSTISALRRHAEIAHALRDAGWSVITRS